MADSSSQTNVAPSPAAMNATDEREKSKKISGLSALWPFMLPNRLLMAAAIFALVLTAMISLALPLAVRRVIDNFGTADGTILDQYFLNLNLDDSWFHFLFDSQISYLVGL